MPAPSTPVRYRINTQQELLLKLSAVSLDLIGFLLMLTIVGEVATEIIGFLGNILFITWFWLLGARYLEGKVQSKVMTVMVNAIIEVFPFVNGVFPGFSVQAWRLISILRKEDEEKAAKEARKRSKHEQAQARRLAIMTHRRTAQLRAEQAQLQMAANDNEITEAENDNEEREEQRQAA